jgi:hypothetical protein
VAGSLSIIQKDMKLSFVFEKKIPLHNRIVLNFHEPNTIFNVSCIHKKNLPKDANNIFGSNFIVYNRLQKVVRQHKEKIRKGFSLPHSSLT